MIRIITTANDAYSEILELRNRVLREPLGMDIKNDDLSDESDCTFLAYYNDNEVMIGCIKIKNLDRVTCQLQQMAVLQEYQRQGIGSKLLSKAESLVKEQGAKTIIIEARDYAIPFYQHHGYQVVSDIFEKVTIPHRRMVKTI